MINQKPILEKKVAASVGNMIYSRKIFAEIRSKKRNKKKLNRNPTKIRIKMETKSTLEAFNVNVETGMLGSI